MFKSKRRPLNVPQFEHARLAAWLARHWKQPPIALPSLTRGVLMHDRGYGLLDDDPLLEVAEDRWIEIMDAGLAMRDDDPDADRLARLHIHRLVAGYAKDDALRAEHQARYEELAQGIWHDADLITNLCDRLSFDFCFETPTRRTLQHFTFGLGEDGRLFCDPWPFTQDRIEGAILGFEREDYPTRPVLLEFVAAR